MSQLTHNEKCARTVKIKKITETRGRQIHVMFLVFLRALGPHILLLGETCPKYEGSSCCLSNVVFVRVCVCACLRHACMASKWQLVWRYTPFSSPSSCPSCLSMPFGGLHLHFPATLLVLGLFLFVSSSYFFCLHWLSTSESKCAWPLSL